MTHPYRIPHYPNDTDYTTNAASYYDDLARKNALLKHLAMRIWEYDKELAKRFLQWEENLATINEDVKKMLQDWLDDGTLAHIINEEIFSELNREIQDLLASFESHKQELADAEQAKKEVDLNKAKAHYLFDLNLSQQPINQGIAIDETRGILYASQVFTVPGDQVQSFYLNRMTLGGKLLDTMLVRHGGHGTSFGVEVENGQVFIWSNIMKTNAAGDIGTQWLARFPYVAGGTVDSDSPSVTKYKEYPDRNYYQSAVCDNKNGLLGLRITNSLTNLDSHMELYNLADVKNGNFNMIGSFNFTPEMNNSTIQGIAIDGTSAYLSFGMHAGEYALYHGNMATDTLVSKHTAAELQLQQGAGVFENDVSEPEGLFMYTDPRTGNKTLFQVIVSSAPSRRRNRLYGISSNEGIQKFVGYALENTQQHPLTLNNGKGKAINAGFNRLDMVTDPGEYYISTVESSQFEDFPLPGVAGWFFSVSARDTAGGVIQTLRRNSTSQSTTYKRVVSGDKQVSPWEGLGIYPVFANGYSDYITDTPEQKVMFTKLDNTLNIMGIVKPPEVLPLNVPVFTLPSGFRPSVRQFHLVSTANGMMECLVDANGEVRLTAYKTDADNPAYVHLNITAGMNGIV